MTWSRRSWGVAEESGALQGLEAWGEAREEAREEAWGEAWGEARELAGGTGKAASGE